MAHLPVARQHPTRRSVLKSAALGSVAAVASPHVKGTYAAGTLTFGAVGCGLASALLALLCCAV